MSRTVKTEIRHYRLWELGSNDDNKERFDELVDLIDRFAFDVDISILPIKEWSEETEINSSEESVKE